MFTVEGLMARMRADDPGKDWRGWCQLVAWYAVRLTGTAREDMVTYGMASDAYRASRIVSYDPDAAPAGAFHYWANPHPEGHVAVALGNGECLMASGLIGGDGLGVIGVREYTRLSGNPYLGWANTNGANDDIRPRFAAATEVAKEEPNPEIILEESMQYIIKSPKRPHAAIVGGKFVPMKNSEELAVVQKLQPMKILDKLNDREYDVIRSIVLRDRPVTGQEVEAILRKANVRATVDVEKIAAAVNDELAARLSL